MTENDAFEKQVADAVEWVKRYRDIHEKYPADSYAQLVVTIPISPLLSTGHRESASWIHHLIAEAIRNRIKREFLRLCEDALLDVHANELARKDRLIQDAVDLLNKERPHLLACNPGR